MIGKVQNLASRNNEIGTNAQIWLSTNNVFASSVMALKGRKLARKPISAVKISQKLLLVILLILKPTTQSQSWHHHGNGVYQGVGTKSHLTYKEMPALKCTGCLDSINYGKCMVYLDKYGNADTFHKDRHYYPLSSGESGLEFCQLEIDMLIPLKISFLHQPVKNSLRGALFMFIEGVYDVVEIFEKLFDSKRSFRTSQEFDEFYANLSIFPLMDAEYNNKYVTEDQRVFIPNFYYEYNQTDQDSTKYWLNVTKRHVGQDLIFKGQLGNLSLLGDESDVKNYLMTELNSLKSKKMNLKQNLVGLRAKQVELESSKAHLTSAKNVENKKDVYLKPFIAVSAIFGLLIVTGLVVIPVKVFLL